VRFALTRLPDQLVVVDGVASSSGLRRRPRRVGAEREPHARLVSGFSFEDLSSTSRRFTRAGDAMCPPMAHLEPTSLHHPVPTSQEIA
jgi:hypothetical protein